MQTQATATQIITAEQLLQHWQGHRRLTRRLIEAFPEDQLFTHSLGGMRTFGELTLEFLAMTVPMIQELTSEEKREYEMPNASNRADLLALWDRSTEQLEELWPGFAPATFQETQTVFGAYTSKVYDLILYTIDNEIHHRGQGYVYLRSLGITPPPFYERD